MSKCSLGQLVSEEETEKPYQRERPLWRLRDESLCIISFLMTVLQYYLTKQTEISYCDLFGSLFGCIMAEKSVS